ncbi:hypothetical protein PUR71_09220 [Streptomyces sp. SP17BM10]|uniref:hypothetical protein n=1 Tax=Streptomyces sp. SP17BM10 TaxID=3002530 RepID=UPI002E78440E|nr:hypothetical protein [Streptomyces sp. SP17BM10]MEE1783096.1 hypothetical protein [Streptomyces sp. SP17BM10]
MGRPTRFLEALLHGYGRALLTQLLTAAGHTPEQASAAIARLEYDVLDWAAAAAESTTWCWPEGHSDDFDNGWTAGCDATQARLAERAEQARLEARNGGLPVPPGPTTRPAHPTPEGTAQ